MGNLNIDFERNILIYNIDPDEKINMPYYKAFETSSPEGFVPFTLSESEQGRAFVYDLSSRLPLRMITANGMDDSGYLDYTKQFLRILRFCIANKIKFGEIILDVEKCYINACSGKLELIYTPIADAQRQFNIWGFLKEFSYLFTVGNSDNCAAMSAVRFIDNNQGAPLQSFNEFIENYQIIDNAENNAESEEKYYSPVVSAEAYQPQPEYSDDNVVQADNCNSNDAMNEISQESEKPEVQNNVYLNDTYMPQQNDSQQEMSIVGEAVGREYVPMQQPQYGHQQPVHQNPPMNQPMNPPMNQPINQPMNPPINPQIGYMNQPPVYVQQNMPCPFLIRVRTGERFPINAPIVKIGKKAELVDFCITNNNAVSRVHVSIFVRAGRYFILDNNSTNFTYIFNNRIPPQTEIEIMPGTTIRLADELFEFRYL